MILSAIKIRKNGELIKRNIHVIFNQKFSREEMYKKQDKDTLYVLKKKEAVVARQLQLRQANIF
jgi:hypothetical protein